MQVRYPHKPSDTLYSEATPAAWAAHNKDRDKLQDISREMLGSAFDLVMAAGHPFYDNDHQKVVRLPSFSGHPICTDPVSVGEDVHCESTAQEVHAGVPA